MDISCSEPSVVLRWCSPGLKKIIGLKASVLFRKKKENNESQT